MSDIQSQISLAVLAGGKARRMGGDDKGLVTIAGKAMIEHVLAKYAPKVANVQIIANRNQDKYQAFGHPVYGDQMEGFQGPLAGMRTALSHCQTPLLLVVPCDAPMLPDDLIERMHQQMETEQSDIAVACDEQREHSVVLMMRRTVLESLDEFLSNGDRKILLWYNQRPLSKVMFSGLSNAFANINTVEQLSELEPQLQSKKDS